MNFQSGPNFNEEERKAMEGEMPAEPGVISEEAFNALHAEDEKIANMEAPDSEELRRLIKEIEEANGGNKQ